MTKGIKATAQNRQRFSDSLFKKLEPKSKPYKVWDAPTPGLYIQVYKTGRIIFKYFYRFHGKQRFLTIGKYGAFTIQQARDRVKYFQGLIAGGEDPYDVQNEKKAEHDREGVMVLQDFLDKQYEPWLLLNRKAGKETIDHIKQSWESFLIRRLDAIEKKDIDARVQDWLHAGAKPATIWRKLDDLRAMYNRAIEWDVVTANPAAGIERPRKVADDRVRYLSPDEKERLLAALEARDETARDARRRGNEARAKQGRSPLPALVYKDFLTPVVRIAMLTGMRRGELLGLTWPMVNFEQRVITVSARTAKSQKTRHIPMHDDVFDILNKWGEQSGRDGLLFPHPVTGEKMTIIKKSWGLVIEKAGISDFRFHDLRHHFASSLVMAGADLNTVRELLGHADLMMTLRYTHLSPDHKAEAISRI